MTDTNFAPTDSVPKVFVHLDYGRSPSSWYQAFVRNQVFEEWPYGYQLAAPHVDLQYSVDAAEGPVHRFLRRSLSLVLGFDAWHAWRNRVGLKSADVVWTHTEHEHLAVALLKKLGVVGNVALLGQSVWLWDSWFTYGQSRRRLYRWLLSAVDRHTTLSSHNAAVASSVLGRDVDVVPFGIEMTFALPPRPPARSDALSVVAPGNDRHRDWPCLLEVARRNPDLDILVLSSRRRPRRLVSRDVPNFRVRTATTTSEMIDALAAADVVAIPLVTSLHASGVTVGFEALAAGRPVAMTRTGGVEAYFGSHVMYAEPERPESLAEAIRRAAAQAGDTELLEANRAHLTDAGLLARDFALRHVLMTYAMMGRLSADDAQAATRFEPVRLPQTTPYRSAS